jgi:hypothetical protein
MKLTIDDLSYSICPACRAHRTFSLHSQSGGIYCYGCNTVFDTFEGFQLDKELMEKKKLVAEIEGDQLVCPHCRGASQDVFMYKAMITVQCDVGRFRSEEGLRVGPHYPCDDEYDPPREYGPHLLCRKCGASKYWSRSRWMK